MTHLAYLTLLYILVPALFWLGLACAVKAVAS